MRRVIARLAFPALVAGCAQAGMPPGGPPDEAPPQVVRITPDSNQANVRARSVTLQFDEVISERPQGVPALSDLFVISPSRGPLRLSWRRTAVEISPGGGLRPNTTYSVEMLPGLVDLEGNVDSVGVRWVFSTGPEIAAGVLTGRVFEWTADRHAPRAYVEALALPDSQRYAGGADSLGSFAIRNVQPGRYLLRAIVDQNRNRELDPRELFDTVTVELSDSLGRDMLAALRDSLGPGLTAVEVRDTLRLRVPIDRPLDTLFTPVPATFTLKAADSTELPIARVLTQADVDRMAADSARTKALQDSVQRAAREDSLRRADTTTAVTAGPARPTGRRPGAVVAPPPTAAPPTAAPPPKPSARIPSTVLYLELAQPLRGGTSYRLRAVDLRSVSAATRTSERVFTVPRPQAPADTARARPDSGRARPDSGRARPDSGVARPRRGGPPHG